MFNFELEGGSHSSTYYRNKLINFDPPVYEQRYCMAVRILEHSLFEGQIKKVVDFGCAEMKLLELLKRVPHVEHILEASVLPELVVRWRQVQAALGDIEKVLLLKIMDECFDFDLDFFGQPQPDAVECQDVDFRELARRIADTDNLVRTVNSLRVENELLKRQLGDFSKSANDVQLLYQKETLRVSELQGENQKLSSRVETAERELTCLEGDKVQRHFYYNQLEEDWKNNLDEEKKRYTSLEANYHALQEKYKEITSEDKRSPQKKPEIVTTVVVKKRDSNKASRMVSRGTQYQSSTTTRSTCTSAFIKKQSIGVNFPEVVPVAIEDIFLDTIMDSPSLLSPIQEIADPNCTVETQTDNVTAPPTISVGTCTQLCNVRNEIDYITENKSQSEWVKRNFVLGKTLAMRQPQLSDLWDLLGQTIFALIGSGNGRVQNFEDFNSEIEMLRNRVEKYSESNGGENIPKKEVNISSCSSPVPDGRNPEQHEIITNEPMEIQLTNSHELETLKNESDSDSIPFGSASKSDDLSIAVNRKVASDGMQGEHDTSLQDECQLSFIKEEMEMLERKLVVISPIRDAALSRIHPVKLIVRNNEANTLPQQVCAKIGIENAEKIQPNKSTINIEVKTQISNKARLEMRLERKRIKRRLKRKNVKLKKKTLKEDCKTLLKAEVLKATALKFKQECQKGSHEGESEELRNTNVFDVKSKTETSPQPCIRIQCNKELNFDTTSSCDISTLTRNVLETMTRDRVDANLLAFAQKLRDESDDSPEITCSDESFFLPSCPNPTAVVSSDREIVNSKLNSDESFSNSELAQSPQDVISMESPESIALTMTKNTHSDDSTQTSDDEEDFFGFPSDDLEDSLNVDRCIEVYDESPKSPDASEASCSYFVREIPLEREEEYDSDYSPASPFFNSSNPSEVPQEIPQNRLGYYGNDRIRKSESLLGRFIAKYKNSKHISCTRNTRPETAEDGKVRWILRKVIERYLTGPGDSASCLKCAKHLLNRSRGRWKLLMATFCEVIEDTDEEISNEYTPPATLMAKSHQRIVLLIKTLSKHVNELEAKIVSALDERIFNLKSDTMPQQQLINLFHVYLALIDTRNCATNPARLIIFKSLYYYSKLATPLIYHVLVAYPAVIPINQDVDYDKSDPLVDTILSILNSFPYDLQKPQLKHRELTHMARMYFEYERGNPSRDAVIELLITKIRSNEFRNVNYSFALLCKRQGIEWSMQHVLKDRLVPLLKEYTSEFDATDSHDDKVVCILDSISAILKPLPIHCDISSYQKMFVNILYATDRQFVQEAAVLSILRTTRFGYDNCFQILYKWNPSYKISRMLRLSIQTFIHRSRLKKLKILEQQIKGLSN